MSRSFFRTYGFLSAMLLAIVLGCVLGALWPGATCLAPLGTIFINLMFCIVVPLVFCSLSSSIACMKSHHALCDAPLSPGPRAVGGRGGGRGR